VSWIAFHLHHAIDRLLPCTMRGPWDSDIVLMLEAFSDRGVGIQIVNVRAVKSYPSWDTGRLLMSNDCGSTGTASAQGGYAWANILSPKP